MVDLHPSHTVSTTAAGSSPTPHDSASGVHQPEQIILGTYMPSSGRGFLWLKWWPVAVFPPAYLLHRSYRLHRPRRPPPLTPLKLPGLYGLAFTSSMLFMQQRVAHAEMLMSDKRLRIIDRAADVAARAVTTPKGKELYVRLGTDPVLAQLFKHLREENYYSSGVAGKLVWWDRYIWTDEATFDRWMVYFLGNPRGKSVVGLPREDLTTCVLHFATRTSPRKDEISSAVRWSTAFSIPLAVLARWSGRRALYLPMNGLQRLLLGMWMYVELSGTAREIWYLRRIREKDAVSRVIADTFGFDDHGGRSDAIE